MVIMTPSDENECRQMLFTGYHYRMAQAPCATRAATRWALLQPLEKLPIGKGW
jgi:1-deoxy-D-xylulose-5-phosphate synthase